MSSVLCVRNLQRRKKVNTILLRSIILELLARLGVEHWELCFHLVTSEKMARINEKFLAHQGSTDVITFSHADQSKKELLAGEVFISIMDAEIQAEQFHTTWQAEVVRYAIHGVLHLMGFDDQTPPSRKKMKKKENQLVKWACASFQVGELAKS